MPINTGRAAVQPAPTMSKNQKKKKAKREMKVQLVGYYEPPASAHSTHKATPANSVSARGGQMMKMGTDLSGRSLAAFAKANSAGSVAALTMLPEQGAFHYSGTFTAAPMVLARPFSVSEYTFTPQGTSGDSSGQFALGETIVFLRRSVLQMTIRHVRNDAGVYWELHSRRFTGNGGTTSQYQQVSAIGSHNLDFTHWVENSSTGMFPRATYHPTHNDPGVGEFRAMICYGTTLRPSTLTLVRPATDTANWAVRLYRLNGTEWSIQTASTFVAANLSLGFSITASGYYAVEFDCLVGSSGASQVYLSHEGTCEFWKIEPIPGLDDHLLSLQTCRINAASLLISPNSALEDRSGRVTATQLTSGISWLEATRDGYIGSMPGSDSFTFVKGAFGFIKPSSAESYSLRNVVHRNRGGGIESVQERFLVGTDTIAFHVVVPVSSTVVSYPASATHVTTVAGIEYGTDTTWSLAGTPKISPADFELALQTIRDLPQFFENETHGSKILRILRAGTNGALKYGPTVLNILAMLAKLL